MKKIFLLAFLLYSGWALAQNFPGTYYVAYRAGLSMRDKPDVAAKVIDRIPYGTKIVTLDDGAWKEINTEGIVGYWRKVKYNNKTGYIIDNYLLTWPPPKITVTKMTQYLMQVALPHGQKLVVKSGTKEQLTEGGWELHKQLYKNGAEWHSYSGYEYGSDTYFLPNFSLEQAFILLRLIPEFRMVFDEDDSYPVANKTIKRGDEDYVIRVERDVPDDETSRVNRITIDYADGAYYSFTMFQIENQVVILFGSGV